MCKGSWLGTAKRSCDLVRDGMVLRKVDDKLEYLFLRRIDLRIAHKAPFLDLILDGVVGHL
jgi:hypothetical protein